MKDITGMLARMLILFFKKEGFDNGIKILSGMLVLLCKANGKHEVKITFENGALLVIQVGTQPQNRELIQ